MEKITVTKFRGDLKRYLDLLESGGEIEVRGIQISKISEKRGENHVQGGLVDVETGEIRDVEGDSGDVQEEEEEYEEHFEYPCELCDGAESNWQLWEDGEERFVCDGCVRRTCSSEKYYRMVVRGYRVVKEVAKVG